MSQSLILIDALSSACWEKIKREMARFFFFPQGWEMWDFCGC
jgi:hypothetical protein